MLLDRLDYLYTPSDDVEADVRYFVDVLGAKLGFAIEDGGVRVAMIELGGPPAVLLTDHLEGERPIHVYAVEDLDAARRTLEGRDWRRDRTVELPPGPAITFRTPSGVRLAIYAPIRPFVVESFRGRMDFG
jgi:hypothetical protein